MLDNKYAQTTDFIMFMSFINSAWQWHVPHDVQELTQHEENTRWQFSGAVKSALKLLIQVVNNSII